MYKVKNASQVMRERERERYDVGPPSTLSVQFNGVEVNQIKIGQENR